jgi:hypothetical protein
MHVIASSKHCPSRRGTNTTPMTASTVGEDAFGPCEQQAPQMRPPCRHLHGNAFCFESS